MKKLIAAAVAAAVIAPASVLAAGPTLYGKIHMSVDGLDNNGKSSENTQYDEWSLQSNSSRIGVKGSEDLGNGMKVGYLIEWQVDMTGDKGGDNLTTRNRAITLSGDWGTALAGQWDTPYKTVGRKLDLFGDRIGDLRNLNGDHDIRSKNTVAYVTPNMNGFSATVAYVFDLGLGQTYNPNAAPSPTNDLTYSDDNSDNNAWSMNAIYNNGPILVALGYINANDDGQVGNVNSDNQSSWRLGGAYTFGDFKVLASYTDSDNVGWNKDNDPSIWTLGGSYQMGNNTIKLQYADRDKSGIKDAAGSKIKDSADMWVIGLDHAMSKRTTVYAAYASTSNDNDAQFSSWGGKAGGVQGAGHGATAATVMGQDADAFSVGIIHKF